LNQALSKATGYKLVKAERLVPPRPRPKPQSQAGPKRRKPEIPRHYDDQARRIIETVRPRTMTENAKLFALIAATRYIASHHIPGAIVECGVWRGGSMQAVAYTLLACGVRDRALHLFDTFEGMPEPSERDRRYDGEPAVQLLERNPKTANIWAIATIEDVEAAMAETAYPMERVNLHPGLVQDTIPREAPDQIAILRLDTDWYDSTRHELEHLYDRVPPGGVVIFDDYGWWQGARQAVDEFLGARGERLLLVPAASGRIAVKP
jgi:hypothetical protein